jgi:hypothetical protein
LISQQAILFNQLLIRSSQLEITCDAGPPNIDASVNAQGMTKIYTVLVKMIPKNLCNRTQEQ